MYTDTYVYTHMFMYERKTSHMSVAKLNMLTHAYCLTNYNSRSVLTFLGASLTSSLKKQINSSRTSTCLSSALQYDNPVLVY